MIAYNPPAHPPKSLSCWLEGMSGDLDETEL